MRRKSEAALDGLPEVFLSCTAITAAIGRLVRAGRVRQIGPHLYTHTVTDAPDVVVARNLWPIVALLAPGTVVSHRTALENAPSPDGTVYVTGTYRRQVVLPGLTLRQAAGAGPAPGDQPYQGALFLASRARALLENLQPGGQAGASRTVGRAALQRLLAETLDAGGAGALERLREEARGLAPTLGLEAQSRALDRLMDAVLGVPPPAPRPRSVSRTVSRTVSHLATVTCPRCGRREGQRGSGYTKAGDQYFTCVWCRRGYTQPPPAAVGPTLGLTGDNRLTFHESACDAFGIKGATHVVLYYEAETRRLGVALTDDPQEPGAHTLYHRPVGAQVYVTRFLAHFGLGACQGAAYALAPDPESGLLVADLSRPLGPAGAGLARLSALPPAVELPEVG